MRGYLLGIQQAIFMRNGLFPSNRSLERVFEQELTYLLDGSPWSPDRAAPRTLPSVLSVY